MRLSDPSGYVSRDQFREHDQREEGEPLLIGSPRAIIAALNKRRREEEDSKDIPCSRGW